jgi:PAS domain S-box-containing protein
MVDTQLFESLPVAVHLTDADGRVTFYNDAAAELWGRRPPLLTTRWCGAMRLYTADGRTMSLEDSPVALTLREGRPVRGIELIAERPDGTRVRFQSHPTPVRDEAGRLTGAIIASIEQADQGVDGARMAAIVASSSDAIISKTLDGRIRSWNAGATKIFGYRADEIIGRPITTIIPPELHHQEREIIEKLRRGERIEHYETVRVAKDGRRVEVSLSVSPVRDRLGHIVGASKVARDVTQRREAERLQQLLVQELNHRVKNMLATVQAIASQSLRYSKSPPEFASGFMARVQALARVHNLLTTPSAMGAEINEIIRLQVLLAFDADRRVTTSGPSLTLQPKAATHLSLILHELGTNAREYGALSTPQGFISLSWDVLTTDGKRALHLVWRESNGPAVEWPGESGFGTMLIEQTLRSLGGSAALDFSARGLVCEIRMPLVAEIRVAYGDEATQAPIERPSVVETLGRSDLAGKRILVVEDEVMVALEIEAVLKEAGCDVLGPVATVEQAEEMIGRERVDAALLDANLVGRPVDDVANRLIEGRIPFAFVTGYGRSSLPEDFRDWPVLGKPFDPAQLRGFVAHLLARNGTLMAGASRPRAGG